MLDFFKRAHDPFSKHRLEEFRSHQPVAVLSRVRSLELAYQRVCFLGDGAHLPDVGFLLEVQRGANVQATHRGVCVPCARGAVASEHLVQPIGVLGDMLQRHRAIFDERNRLPVGLHRHDDVETGFADGPDLLLKCGIRGAHHGVRMAERSHEVFEFREVVDLAVEFLTGELDQQECRGCSLGEALYGRTERGIVSRETQQRLVQQLDGGWMQLDDVLHGVHRRVEGRKVADAKDTMRRGRLQVELDACEHAEGAFGSDQQVGHVEPSVGNAIDVVTGHPPKDLGKAALDFFGLASVQIPHRRDQTLITCASRTTVVVRWIAV